MPKLLSLAALYALFIAVIALYCLTVIPNTGDEHAMLFQAQIFAHGRLWADAPPLPAFFATDFLAIENGKWFGQYPPLTSVPWVLGIWLGSPALVMGLLSAFTLVTFYRLGRRLGFSARIMGCSVLLLAFSPTWIFQSVSYYAHVSMLLCLLLTLHAMLSWRKSQRLRDAFLFGLAAGAGLTVRPFTMALLLPLVAAWTLSELKPKLREQRIRKAAPGFIAGALIPTGICLFHGSLLLGKPGLPLVRLAGGSFVWDGHFLDHIQLLIHATGSWFGPGWFESGTPKDNPSHRAFDFGLWLMLAVWIDCAVRAVRTRRSIWIFASFAPVMLLAHGFFNGPMQGRFGGRYLFESLPFLFLGMGDRVANWLANPKLRGVAWATCGLYGLALVWELHGTVSFFRKNNLYRSDAVIRATELGLGDGDIVFLKDGPDFGPSWHARNPPDLHGVLFVSDRRPEEDLALLRTLGRHGAYVYFRQADGQWKLTPYQIQGNDQPAPA